MVPGAKNKTVRQFLLGFGVDVLPAVLIVRCPTSCHLPVMGDKYALTARPLHHFHLYKKILAITQRAIL